MKGIEGMKGTAGMVVRGGRTGTALQNRDGEVAEALSAQYRRALEGVRNILIFGAMLNHLANCLSSQTMWRADLKGQGLKGWLAENCPEIHYKTANSFLQLARGMAKTLEVPAEADLPRLLGASEEELTEEERPWRERIDEALDGRTKRQLEFDFGIRGERSGNWGGDRRAAALKNGKTVGRPSKSLEAEQLAAEAWGDAFVERNAEAVLEKGWHLRLDGERRERLLVIARRVVEDLEGKGRTGTPRQNPDAAGK